MRDIAAVGDTVNTTARLACAATAGEILVSETAYTAAGLDLNDPPQRLLDLKGKREPFAVRVLSSSVASSAGSQPAPN